MQTNNVYEMSPQRPKPHNGLWWIIAIVIITALLSSCSVTHKTKSVSRVEKDSSSLVKTDSSATKTTDSTVVKKDNTVTVKETDGSYTKETIFEFADEPVKKDSSEAINSPIPAADYFPQVKSTGRLKKITVKENGTLKTKETKAANTVDSTQFANHETATVNKTADTKMHEESLNIDKGVHRTNYWGWLWIGLIVALVIAEEWYFGWLQMLFAWFKKRSRKNNST